MGAPVSDAEGIHLGTVGRDQLLALADLETTLDGRVDPTAGTVSETADLGEAIDALSTAGGHWVTVTDDGRHVTGILTAGAIVRAYRRAQSVSGAQPGADSIGGAAVTAGELPLSAGSARPPLANESAVQNSASRIFSRPICSRAARAHS
jgi:hypothetical protein